MDSRFHLERGTSMVFPAPRHWWAGAIIFVLAMVLADCAFNGGTPIWALFSSPASDSSGYVAAGPVVVDVSLLSLLVNRAVSDISMGIFAVVAAFNVYKKWLWRYDKALGIPVLLSEYKGTLEYPDGSGGKATKPCDIKVDQEMERIQMTLFTKETQSVTLSARFIEECGEPVLYYTYRARSLEFEDPGFYKLGAAALFMNANRGLEGRYWTSDRRSGKLYFSQEVPRSPSKACTSADLPGAATVDLAKSCCVTAQERRTIAFLLSLLQELREKLKPNFAGLGIIVCSDSFDFGRCVSLRPDGLAPSRVNLHDPDVCSFLKKRASKCADGHDGFIVANEMGDIIACAQYLFPPFPCNIRPDYRRGTRSFSALAGSQLEGVLLIAIMSEDGSYAIYRNGEIFFDSEGSC